MQMHELSIIRIKKKRRGRGGKRGTTSGRGTKGQKARSGGNVNPLFEGGRSSLIQRMKKKRGFTSKKLSMRTISLSALNRLFSDGEIVNLDTLVLHGLLRKSQKKAGVKITNMGKIDKKLTISPDVDVTKAALAQIIKAGGNTSDKK